MSDVSRLDVASLSDEDLDQVHNSVLRALAERAKPGGRTPSLMYDRHGSGHSKNSVMAQLGEQVVQPDVGRPG